MVDVAAEEERRAMTSMEQEAAEVPEAGAPDRPTKALGVAAEVEDEGVAAPAEMLTPRLSKVAQTRMRRAVRSRRHLRS